MIAHVKFTTEEYEQFYQTFQYGEVEDGSMDDELPDNKFCQTFSGKIQYQYPNMNCLSHDYLYGCANDGSVLIRIDEDQQTFQSQELPIQWE